MKDNVEHPHAELLHILDDGAQAIESSAIRGKTISDLDGAYQY